MTSYMIDYFEIPAKGTDVTRTFFGQAFGWSFQSYGPEYDEIRDAQTLGGINGDANDQSAGPLIGIRTDDIAAAETAVLRAGGTISRPVYDYPGGKRLFFRTPGGIEMLLYQPG